jgi:hypothetical protein
MGIISRSRRIRVVTMDTHSALKVLQAAVDHCRFDDIETPKITAGVDFLEARATIKWAFGQFREALKEKPGADLEFEGRCQMLSASLNGIQRVVGR